MSRINASESIITIYGNFWYLKFSVCFSFGIQRLFLIWHEHFKNEKSKIDRIIIPEALSAFANPYCENYECNTYSCPIIIHVDTNNLISAL